jgi:hypothetical protein
MIKIVITLVANKRFLVQQLFNEDGDGLIEHLKGAKLH